MPRSFYSRRTTVVARDLLGCVLVHLDDDIRRAGRIVETEAYIGAQDLACHASKGRTPRTDVMFGPPGRAYVYLIYGMYHCFNVVTEREGHASAVLIRAIEPIEECLGTTDGPGKVCRALRITREHNKADVTSSHVWIENRERSESVDICMGPRIGVDYAGDWRDKPLRYWIAGNAHVSKSRTTPSTLGPSRRRVG